MSLVEVLEYGADDETGSFVEALIIRTEQGERYVLHKGEPSLETYEHRKIEFGTKELLLERYPYALGERWTITDKSCGYDIPPQEFQDARRINSEDIPR